MAAFDEVRLPGCIERGAQGGPGFKTTIIMLSSGFEKRNQDWSETRGEWNISYGLKERADLDALITFFFARRGRARGFRFKDWSDYKLKLQTIGIGDGANDTFQLFKRYTSGGQDYDRPLTKIVANTDQLYVNTVLQPTGNYSIDYNTGLVVFDPMHIPAMGANVSASAEFDVPVRFDIDKLGVTMQQVDLGAIPAINLVELKQ
jgi:uncharacterized protein (TIGR02217 family)